LRSELGLSEGGSADERIPGPLDQRIQIPITMMIIYTKTTTSGTDDIHSKTITTGAAVANVTVAAGLEWSLEVMVTVTAVLAAFTDTKLIDISTCLTVIAR